MEISQLTRKITALGVTVALSSGVTYWLCTSSYESQIRDQKEMILSLRDSVNEANVTKRVSVQMEEIANAQKDVADMERGKAVIAQHDAEEQTRKADAERRNALEAKALADEAEREARHQAAKAEQESKAAQQARDIADAARAKADTLRYVAKGQSLAQTSITQFNAGKFDLARLLSYAGYRYTVDYGGDPYQQDVYTSILYNAHNARSKVAQFTGGIRDIACIKRQGTPRHIDADMVAVTDYGEIYLFTPKLSASGAWQGFEYTKLFSDNDYFFMDLCIEDSAVYALDVDGRVVVLDIYATGKQKAKIINVASSTREGEKWFRMLRKKDGNLIAVGEHQISWLDTKKHEIYRQKYIQETISEAGIGDGKLITFTRNNKLYVFHEGEPVEWRLTLPDKGYVTNYYYHKGKHLHAVGLDNGNIVFYDNGGNMISEFTGHSAPITNMEHNDWCFVSSSYDKTIRIWNLSNIGGLVVPLELKCNSWPLTIEIDRDVNTLRVGYANGEVESIRISVDDNSASVRKHLNRDFTPEEWNYYIGKEEPYKTFFKK